MFRALLLAVVFMPSAPSAETLRLPGLSPKAPLLEGFPDCIGDPFKQTNCVRVLACIGEEGLWFDGQARGWDQGTVQGVISDKTACAGQWNSNGPFGTGNSTLKCADDVEVRVIYHTKDNETGTVIGTGRDSKGRAIKVWTGLFVLDYLRQRGGSETVVLPCGPQDIPIS